MHAKRRKAALLLLAAAFMGARPGYAAITARYGATSTLLADGNILIVGGTNYTLPPAPGTLVPDIELSLENRGGAVQILAPTGDPFVSRSSHTATLLPTGEVLVAGGVYGNNTVADTVQIFSPSLNCWRATIPMTSERYNHTATLLRSGKVLICGGQKDDRTMSNSCDLFAPTVPAPATCGGGPGGAFGAPVNLLVPRSLHTATLLADGRVFLTGGLNTDYPATNTNPGGYMVTSEVYVPESDTTFAAANLITARAYHRATLMGNGKVFISGGFTNQNVRQNRGYLESTEIYDPVADHMSPAAPMIARDSQHAQVLNGDGSITIFGGLGNITTNYFDASATLNSATSFLTGCFAAGSSPPGVPAGSCATPPLQPPAANIRSTMSIVNGSVELPIDIQLDPKITGRIQDGFILFSSPTITFPGGFAALTPGTEDPNTGALSGAYLSLNGESIGCDSTRGCGIINAIRAFTPRGQYFITPQEVTTEIKPMSNPSLVTWAGCITSDASKCPDNSDSNIEKALDPTSQFNGPVTFAGLPVGFVGATVNSAELTVTAGVVASTGVFSFAITRGVATVAPTSAVQLAADGLSGQFTANVAISNVIGDVTATTTTPQSGPINLKGLPLDQLAGMLTLVVDSVTLRDLSGDEFKVDVATIVIRKMLMGDANKYDPLTNAWSPEVQEMASRFGTTATLMPNADLRMFGGSACGNATCSAYTAVTNVTVVLKQQPFTRLSAAMASPRGNHTSTLLPNGKLLIAGGSNGPNVLNSAELFDPVSGAVSQTGSMNETRDLHTATLLPNGRVLVAGGFSTNATSTASTSGAEIYYPDTGVWLRTSTMPFASDNHTATLLANGNVLVAGGYSNGVYLNSAAVYITTKAVWEPLTSMPVARALHSATLLQDGRVLFAGGINQTGVLNSAYLYDPNDTGATRPWVLDTPIGARVHSHAAVQLKDGTVLLNGGNDGFGETDTSYIYVPLAGGSGKGSWTNTSNRVNTKRFGHNATLLPDGRVMIAGGSQALGNALTAVETFDVSVSSWQSVGALAVARSGASLAIGSDNNIYVFGGSNGLSMESSAEKNYFTDSPDARSLGASPTVRQSSLTAVDASPFQPGNFLTIRGQKMLGIGEAAGGGAGNSSHHNPRIVLQSLASSGGASQNGGTFTLDVTTRIYSKGPADPNLWANANSSITVQLPSNAVVPNPGQGGQMMPYGWYHLRTFTNAVYSNSLLVQAGPPKPTGAPGAISGFVQGASSVTWSWSQGTLVTGTFDGYAVYSASSGIFITTVAASAAPFIQFSTQTSLAPNTAAAITVAGYTLSGDGPMSLGATYYTLASTATTPFFSSVSYNSLTLNWGTNGNTPETVYEVSMSSDNFALDFSTPVPTLVQNTNNFASINFLQTNTEYSFRVRAFNGAGLPSNFSIVVTTKTRAPISDLSGSAVDATTIEWNWRDPSGDVSYKVYNATSGAVLATIAPINGNPAVPTFKDVGLATNSARAILVSAVTPAGEGPLTPSPTVYTLAAVPGSGTTPFPSASISTGSFTAIWTANGNPINTPYQMVVTDDSGAILSTATTTGFSGSYAAFPKAASTFIVKVAAVNGDSIVSPFLVLGTSGTLAVAPSALMVTSATLSSISLSWSGGVNSSSATYEVTYTTAVTFSDVGAIRTALPFSSRSNQNDITISDLLTATTYSIRVQGQSLFNVKTAFSNTITTSPFNGGVAYGSMGATVNHLANTIMAGSIGMGRQLTLRVSANTFPSDTFVTISTFAATGPSPCPGGVDVGISITPDPSLQPLKPLLLTFAYTDAEIGALSLSKAQLMRIDASGLCVPLQTTVDAANHRMTAALNHLSRFQLAQVNPTSSVDQTVIFPNPFYPSQGNGYVTFSQMPAASRVRIFTTRGELVNDLTANGSGLAAWNGRNLYGRSAASGVYLAVIEGNGAKNILKVVVLR